MRKIFLFILSLTILYFLLANNINTFALASQRVPIITYHYIRDYNNAQDPIGIRLSVSPAIFDKQMNYLTSHGYTPITLDMLYGIWNGQAQSPTKPVVLTFDDGYIDFYANAYPILKKYNFHAVSFVVTGFVGKPAYLSWSNIKEMQSSSLISFEAHTVTHAYLPRLSYANMLNELLQSKTTLQSQTGVVINFIAYPYGASNGTVQNAAAKAGFVGGLGTWGGYASYKSMNMPRFYAKNSLQSISSLLP